MTDFRVTKAQNARASALFLHGAGAPMDSAWMEEAAGGLAAAGVTTWRAEFRYMQRRRKDGKKRPPPKAERLLPELHDLLGQVRLERQKLGLEALPFWLVGKSMGGRLATLYASQPEVWGAEDLPDQVLVLGYPFHPLGKPDRLRVSHFPDLACPAWIWQGTQDPMGSQDRVETLALPSQVSIRWIEKARHDLNRIGERLANLKLNAQSG